MPGLPEEDVRKRYKTLDFATFFETCFNTRSAAVMGCIDDD